MGLEDHIQQVDSMHGIVKKTTETVNAAIKQWPEHLRNANLELAITMKDIENKKSICIEKVKKLERFCQKEEEEGHAFCSQIDSSSSVVKSLKEKEQAFKKVLDNVHQQTTVTNKKNNLSEKRIRVLELKRNSVEACKILTSTNFEYKGPTSSGFIHNKKSKILKPFDMDFQKENENIEYLWKTLSDSCSSEWIREIGNNVL